MRLGVRALRDTLLFRDDALAILFEYIFIVTGIVVVAELSNENAVKRAFVAVLDHALEFGAMVCLCRLRPVYVVPDDLYPVEVGVLNTLAKLPFDTRLILFFR